MQLPDWWSGIKHGGSLRRKLFWWFLLISFVPLTGMFLVTVLMVRTLLYNDAEDKLLALQQIKAQQVETYFIEQQNDMIVLGEIIRLTQAEAFKNLKTVESLSRRQLTDWFNQQRVDLFVLAHNAGLLSQLSTANTSPLEQLPDNSRRVLTEAYRSYEFDNLFLLNDEGLVLFSSSADIPEATNLFRNHPNHPLTLAAQQVKDQAHIVEIDQAIYFQDFQLDPDRNVPVAYLAAPVHSDNHDGHNLGIMVVALSVENMSQTIQPPDSLGETAAVYLVGADFRFRSNDPRLVDAPPMIANPQFIAAHKGVRQALAGQSGAGSILNYLGRPVLATWTPLNIAGVEWVMITEVELTEALNPKLADSDQSFLLDYANLYQYDDLFLINPDGLIVFVANHQPIYQANVLTGLYRSTNLGRLVDHVIDTNNTFEIADFERFAPSNNQPAAFMATPLQYQDDLMLVLVAQISLDVINDLMKNRTGLGDTGEIYLVGREGLFRNESRFLTALGIESSVLNPDVPVDTLAWQQALNGQTGAATILDYRGKSVISTWSTVSLNPTSQTNDIKWAVIAEVDEAEVNRPILLGIFVAGLFALGAVVFIFLVTYRVSGQLSAPLVQVADAANRLAQGDLSRRVTVQTDDEIEQVANAFNKMAADIENLVNNLEDVVQERTHQLKVTQNELLTQERMATLGRLSATVSHELRNPLATLRNTTYTLRLKVGNDHELGLDRALDRMDRNVARCDAIIGDLLDYAKEYPLKLQPVQFDGWLTQALEEQTLPPTITVQTDLQAAVFCQLDRVRFHQVITNLVNNAVQAMADMNEPAVLTIQTRVLAEPQPTLQLTVADTGPGIPPEVLPRIFEPLFTTKGFGIGLGLAVVKTIVTQHQGQIRMENCPSRGAQAVVQLPLGEATSA